MINKTKTINTTGSFSLYAANKIYDGGNNGTQIGFYASSSLPTASLLSWTSASFTYFGRGTTLNGNTYRNFSGSFQEIRYYKTALSESTFKDYVMNPYSIEGNTLNSSPDELIFRLPLGGELYTGSISVHPKVTGSWVVTSSFPTNSSCSFSATPTFLPNTEYFFYDQPVVGIQNAVSDKIRLEDNVLPSGDTLSAFRYISQNTEASSSYTANTNLLEVAFSPQDEINDDISSQIGYFNIGDYIGDPAFRSSRLTSYPDLDALRDDYFEKYTKNYNLNDFIRLIKFFDNSLFKMIKDFVPARTSLASGIVIKQHYLERNRYPEPQTSWEDLDLEGTVKPQWDDYNSNTIENFGGGTGGSFEKYNYLANTSQSWNETFITPSGSVTMVHSSQDEFYDGEFSGSLIVVTTQSLAQAYPLNLQEFDYTPIVYSNAAYSLNNSSSFTQGQFLNSNTAPQQGEILMLTPWTIVGFYIDGRAATGESFIKINKFDNNGIDNTIPLGQVNNLLIKYDADSTYTQINVLTISEYPSYYLYEVSNHARTDNYVLDYRVTASLSTTLTIPNGTSPQVIFNTTTYNPNSFYNTTTGRYSVNNIPNTGLTFTLSGTASAVTSTAEMNLFIVATGSAINSGTSGQTIDNSISYIVNVGTPVNFTWTGSYNTFSPWFDFLGNVTDQLGPGKSAIIKILNNNDFYTGGLSITGLRLTTNQIVASSSAEFDSVIFEPNITTVKYYNSDYNPLINNAVDIRQNSLYQDIDYSQGSLVPVNFQELITGSATKATVQDSNYTSARHIIPRYEGSKSTSQKLNVWTNGDIGTYGKLPTIDSNKVWVAYCETIGGYAPERMNASGIVIKYLIDQDGNVGIPNTSENSLYTTQGTFQTGERLAIFANSLNSGQNNYRNIIRGGQRIEPILYNQIGHTPPSWSNSINLTDNNQIGGVTGNFQAYLKPSSNYTVGSTSWTTVKMNSIQSSGSSSDLQLVSTSYRYEISSAMITEGIDLTIDVNIAVYNPYQVISTAYARVSKYDGVNTTTVGYEIGVNGTGFINPFSTGNIQFSLGIPNSNLVTGDQYFVEISTGISGLQYLSSSTWKINQFPIPTSAIPTTGLWNVLGTTYPNNLYLYTTSSDLITYYDNPSVYQEDIAGSGFNTITTPWSLKKGDEFRFEGREDRVWMVDEVTVSSFLSIPYLLIKTDKPITGSVDLDQFLIRRYVDDPSAIIFEGLKPTTGNSPYLVKPEYVSPSLNKNLDSFITDLTQKGLL